MENSLMKVLMLSISVLTVTAEKHCANFVFPTAQNDGVLTVKQDENLTLPFSLQTNGCDAVGPFKITVSKKDRDTNVFVDFCDVGVHDNGSCVTGLHNGCSCLEGQGKYQISKTVDRSDETVWVWLTSNGIAAETYLNFSVLSPPSVTSLTLTTSSQDSVPGPFSLYSPVDVICKWRDGHPPTQAFLLDRHSNPLEPVTYADNRVQYSYPSVHCLDAGLIRCVAPRANHNETATLLVRCPPEFDKESVNEVSVAPNNTNSAADVKFKVRTHTKTITKCKLTSFAMRGKTSKMASNPETKDSSQNAKDCKSSSTLTGTPPDLTLTVRLDNVRKEDEGQWTLTLTNDVGSGRVDFMILIKRAPEFQNSINMTAAAGEDIELKFPLKSHTTHITNCQLVRCDGGEQSFWTRAAGFGLNCLSFVTLAGTPPDLVLTVRLDNVRKQDQGQWRLELTNEAGVGHMNFSLHIELEVSAEHQMPTLTIVATTVPSMLCLVMVIVITTICIKRANRGSKTNVTVRDESIALERRDDRANRTVSTVSQASVNDYHEIPDDIPDEVGESASDGYLVPSPVENTAYGLEPTETTPIYQNELPLEPEQEGIAAAAAADLPPDDVQNPAASCADVEGADNVTNG